MKVIKTIKPGQHGTRRFLKRYGERLVCVRYREEAATRSVFTTVELIVDQREKLPGVDQSSVYSQRDQQWVALKIAYEESELRSRVKRKGGQWSQREKVWVLMYKHAAEIGILDRVIPNLAARVTDVELFG